MINRLYLSKIEISGKCFIWNIFGPKSLCNQYLNLFCEAKLSDNSLRRDEWGTSRSLSWPLQRANGILIKRGMQWLKQDTDAENLFVYVSNGNDPASLYESLGFKYSHDVLDGFIEAYVMAN